eukprot:g12249.t1
MAIPVDSCCTASGANTMLASPTACATAWAWARMAVNSRIASSTSSRELRAELRQRMEGAGHGTVEKAAGGDEGYDEEGGRSDEGRGGLRCSGRRQNQKLQRRSL